jgi:hypothetical protein
MPGKESEPQRERQPEKPYVRAARYAADEPAYAAYLQAQEILFTSECDLSTYRIRFMDTPHVVVLGARPDPGIDEQIARVLAGGEPASLPDDIVGRLIQRRLQAQRLGPWVEGHYRPGKHM